MKIEKVTVMDSGGEKHEICEKQETSSDAELEVNDNNPGYTPFDEIPYSTAQLYSASFQDQPGNGGDHTDGRAEVGALFTFGTSSKVEDGYQYSFCNGDEEDDYDETQPHEEVFDASGVALTEEREEDIGDVSNGIDFHALAEQALQSLDFEYQQIVQSSETSVQVSNDYALGTNASMGVDSATLDADGCEISTGIDESQMTSITQTVKEPSTVIAADTKSIDTNAISLAIEKITLQSPNLDIKFQKWKKQHQIKQNPQYKHSLIHNKPLMAFHRPSDKAKSATANLSRSATLAESIDRLFIKPNASTGNTDVDIPITKNIAKYSEQYNYKTDDVFVIHCIGADRVECQTRETIITAFGPIVKWIHQYHHFENGLNSKESGSDLKTVQDSDGAAPSMAFSWPKHLRIELLGPNVPMHSEKFGSINLLPPIPGRLKSATIFCKNCMYHDYLHELEDPKEELYGGESCIDPMQFPNLVIAYNAGIWGYTDWHPTLCRLDRIKRPVPFVITAYTLPEAEDDSEVFEEVLHLKEETENKVGKIPINDRCLWDAEVNVYASRVVRETKSNDNTYYENGAWQAYLMGV